VKIALYPHTGFWLERVEDAIRLAGKVDDPAVGVTFNLCHWLKVEGSQRDPAPVLRMAQPRLMFVTINGADTGDTKTMGWERLIRPLGEGSYDVGAFLRSLRATGYEGPVGFQGYGIQGDAPMVLKKTMAAWRELQP
jgi:sugar phosphate isomerase/epimerase